MMDRLWRGEVELSREKEGSDAVISRRRPGLSRTVRPRAVRLRRTKSYFLSNSGSGETLAASNRFGWTRNLKATCTTTGPRTGPALTSTHGESFDVRMRAVLTNAHKRRRAMGELTGRHLRRVVSYMVEGPSWGLPTGTCIMGLAHLAWDGAGERCHRLKTWPQYFDAVADGRKTFEIRERRDRDFQVGDVLQLDEYVPTDEEVCAANPFEGKDGGE